MVVVWLRETKWEFHIDFFLEISMKKRVMNVYLVNLMIHLGRNIQKQTNRRHLCYKSECLCVIEPFFLIIHNTTKRALHRSIVSSE